MTLLFTRWLVVALVAIGLGVAGLYRSVCIADERVVHPTVREGRLQSEVGYVSSPPSAAFSDELEAELQRMRRFLGLD